MEREAPQKLISPEKQELHCEKFDQSLRCGKELATRGPQEKLMLRLGRVERA
jgi:hypothetical protein